MTRAIGLMKRSDPATALLDVAAAFTEAKYADRDVAVIGFYYAYGGFISWLMATVERT